MDDFVRDKLTEWGLSEWIERFEDEGVDKESLFCLDDQHIEKLITKVGPNARFKKRLKLLKEEQNPTNQVTVGLSADCHQEDEATANCAQVLPSTSDTGDNGRRGVDSEGESSQWQSPASKRRRNTLGSYAEEIILSDVKNIMRHVNMKLSNGDNTQLNGFLKTKITDLETDKRELVGVFGKTGAGKSSLINAIIGKKNLLPSGRVNACTSVMIKVEANMLNSKYEAEIEFITREEWKDELWPLHRSLGDNTDQEMDDDDDDDDETATKLSALYGEEWKNIPIENLMDNKYFREIPEFLISKRKILTCESPEELSAKMVKYTRTDSKGGEGTHVKQWYWPLVKCVTVRVPQNPLLQHVTLVDLPGNGDRNKSRDKMWKEIVGRCSTVWIVAIPTRAAEEKEAWEILENASSLMGNGGECQHIHFICTKSDLENFGDHSAATEEIKDAVSTTFKELNKNRKHFSNDCFKVFTVSSTEFLKPRRLTPDETEIPKLQEFLQELNDCHSETLNYVSGAHGILSLIEGARCREVAGKKADVCKALEEKMNHELYKIRKTIEEAYEAFEKCLDDGVEKSKSLCEVNLKSVLYPRRIQGRGFHRILRCVVENSGTYKPKKKKQINLNAKLSSCLTDSIDEEFRATFPNETKSAPFKGVIEMFSLDTEKLIQKYKDVELQLIFLKTEEEKIKTKLNKLIRDQKKNIYLSLTETIEEKMQDCYNKAKEIRGQDALKNMRHCIETHVRDTKNTMFSLVKDDMLSKLNKLKTDILDELEKTLKESIELSLKTDDYSIPEVSVELGMVKKHYDELKGSQDEDN